MARKAEEARRAAAAEEHTEEEIREADAGRDQLREDSVRGEPTIAQLQEQVRQLRAVLTEREEIDKRRDRLAAEEASLTQRRAVLTAAQRLSEPAPRGLGADRSVETSRSADRTTRGRVTDEDDCPITDPPAYQVLLLTVTQYLLRKLLLDFVVDVPKLSPPELHVALQALLIAAPAVVSNVRPATFYDVIALISLVEAHCASFTSSMPRTVQNAAQAYMTGLIRSMRGLLNAALKTLDGDDRLVASCAVAFLLEVQDTPALSLNLERILKDSVSAVVKIWNDSTQRDLMKTALADRKCRQAAELLPTQPAYQLPYQSQPPPPGLTTNASPPNRAVFGTLPKLGHLPCRWPAVRDACARCGKGSLPGSIAHRAAQCQADPAEIDNWIRNGVPVA
jgi:hypothetical protein